MYESLLTSCKSTVRWYRTNTFTDFASEEFYGAKLESLLPASHSVFRIGTDLDNVSKAHLNVGRVHFVLALKWRKKWRKMKKRARTLEDGGMLPTCVNDISLISRIQDEWTNSTCLIFTILRPQSAFTRTARKWACFEITEFAKEIKLKYNPSRTIFVFSPRSTVKTGS